MKQLIIILLILPFLLQSQWQKTDYGYVSIQPVLGDIRWIPDENAIISSYLGDYNKFDLISGAIVKSTNIKDQDSVFVHISNDLAKSISVKSHALFKHPKVYLVFDFNSIELGGANDSWKDSILILDELHYTLSSYEAIMVSLNDSLVAISINFKYGAGQEYWRDITFFYNLKTQTYKSQRGIVQSFNPLSNYTVLKSVYRTRDYPDIDKTQTLLNSYNITNDYKNTYSNLDHNEDENIVIGNIGIHALFINNDFLEHFKNGKDKPELVYKDKYDEGLYCLSNDESFVLRLNSNTKDSKLTITKFGTSKIVDSISFISNSKLTKFLFVVEDYAYLLDEDKYLHKVALTDFTTDIKTQTIRSQEIDIYPNPTSDYFTVEFQEKSNVESIQVFDVKGYRELNFILNKEIVEYKIDFRELQRGTYFIEIITSSGFFHKKIIKF